MKLKHKNDYLIFYTPLISIISLWIMRYYENNAYQFRTSNIQELLQFLYFFLITPIFFISLGYYITTIIKYKFSIKFSKKIRKIILFALLLTALIIIIGEIFFKDKIFYVDKYLYFICGILLCLVTLVTENKS